MPLSNDEPTESLAVTGPLTTLSAGQLGQGCLGSRETSAACALNGGSARAPSARIYRSKRLNPAHHCCECAAAASPAAAAAAAAPPAPAPLAHPLPGHCRAARAARPALLAAAAAARRLGRVPLCRLLLPPSHLLFALLTRAKQSSATTANSNNTRQKKIMYPTWESHGRSLNDRNPESPDDNL